MDVARDKFMRLMQEVADLEDRIEDLEEEMKTAEDSPNPGDADIVLQELNDLREQLTERRNELARTSDGCGTPHPQS
jgi:cell division septum initiation protein DivIVA